MLIYDPVSNFFSNKIAARQRYRCIVDGSGELRGEWLPIGTEEEILAWIKARYKILAEIWVFDKDDIGIGQTYIQWKLSFSPLWMNSETWNPPHVTKWYLVEVGGMEKVFILRPFPDGLLEWPVKGELGCVVEGTNGGTPAEPPGRGGAPNVVTQDARL